MSRSTVVYRGVPIWLFVVVVLALVARNYRLRTRPGNVPVQFRPQPGSGWSRGNAVWVDDVIAVRTGLGDRSESFHQVTAVTTRTPEAEEVKNLQRLEEPVIATIQLAGGEMIEFAVARKHETLLLGPFATEDSNPAETPGIDQVGTAGANQNLAAAAS